LLRKVVKILAHWRDWSGLLFSGMSLEEPCSGVMSSLSLRWQGVAQALLCLNFESFKMFLSISAV